jgi:phage terminase large subunit
MQSFNSETIKSLEGYDLAWIEEAQTLSEKSMNLLRPTIRNDNSELWFGWNPRYRTDPVDMFFRKTPPPEAVSVHVNWRDNPWFPEVLRKDMEHDRNVDADLAEHIWEGGYEIGEGAILARWIERAEKAGLINDDVAYDKDGPGIEISSDIGFHDTATWWFWQRRLGGAALLDHDKASGLEAADWIDRLQARLDKSKLPLRKIWLPHDAKAQTFHSKHSAVEQFIRAFGMDRVGIVPQSKIPDRINAARTFVKQCEFHKSNCEEGLNGLRAWEFEYNPDTLAFSRKPLHNWASHDGDGFSYGCQVMKGLTPDAEPKKPEPLRGVENITVNELIKITTPKRERV